MCFAEGGNFFVQRLSKLFLNIRIFQTPLWKAVLRITILESRATKEIVIKKTITKSFTFGDGLIV